MQVYKLPETNDHKVLLTGDLDFVSEFASVLSKNSIVFSILPPMDTLDELDLEQLELAVHVHELAVRRRRLEHLGRLHPHLHLVVLRAPLAPVTKHNTVHMHYSYSWRAKVQLHQSARQLTSRKADCRSA